MTLWTNIEDTSVTACHSGPFVLFVCLLMSCKFLGNHYFGFHFLFIPFLRDAPEFLGGDLGNKQNEKYQALLRILPSSNPGSLSLYNNS